MLLKNSWLSGHWQNTNSLSTIKVLKFSTELNSCHAPISRIKSFEHLLSLTLPLSVLWCAVTVNDFLKISIFHIWFTCLKCLVEHTQVCKNSRYCQSESKVFGQSLEISFQNRGWSRGNRQGISILPFSFFLFTYLDYAVILSRENHCQQKQLHSPLPSSSLSLSASTQLDNQAH